MTVNTGLMTADELWNLPDDGMRHELVRGEVIALPFRTFEQGHLTSVVNTSLGRHATDGELGKALVGVGCHLTSGSDTVRAPAVAFVSRERLAGLSDRDGWLPGAPNLVIEIIDWPAPSPDMDERTAEWLEHGAQLVFVVNPRRQTVAIHRPGQPIRTLGVGDELNGEDVVPGWSLSVRELFEQD